MLPSVGRGSNFSVPLASKSLTLSIVLVVVPPDASVGSLSLSLSD